MNAQHDLHPLFNDPAVRQMREDMALALRAAAHFGLGEGVCNHFSMAMPGREDLFLVNPPEGIAAVFFGGQDAHAYAPYLRSKAAVTLAT